MATNFRVNNLQQTVFIDLVYVSSLKIYFKKEKEHTYQYWDVLSVLLCNAAHWESCNDISLVISHLVALVSLKLSPGCVNKGIWYKKACQIYFV